MSEIVWLTLLFACFHKGDTETSCDVPERNVLRCQFSINVNTTQTDFSVYVQLNNSNEELLVDCVWMNHHLRCLEMKDVDMKQQVSETVEISIPTRFVTANGTYRCNLEGQEHKQGKPCGFYEKQEDIQNNQFDGSIHENHPNDKAAEYYVPWIAGDVSGAVAICILGIIIIVRYRHVKKGSRESDLRTVSETGLLPESTETSDATNGDNK